MFDSALHITYGYSAAGILREFGAKYIVPLPDDLQWGQCAIDYATHQQRREKYRRDFQSALDSMYGVPPPPPPSVLKELREIEAAKLDLATELAGHADKSIFIWSDGSLSGQLSAAFTLNAIQTTGAQGRSVRIVDDDEDRSRWIGLNRLLEAGDSAGFRSLIMNAVVVSESSLTLYADLWAAFADGTPAMTLSLLSRVSELFPNVYAAEQYRRHFPLRHEGATYLSELDRTILGALSESEWKSPLELIKHHENGLLHLMPQLGDRVISFRLAAWASRAPYAVESRKTGSKVPMRAVDFRLTSLGMELLRDGLRSIDLVPSYEVGGTRAYESQNLWLNVDDVLAKEVSR